MKHFPQAAEIKGENPSIYEYQLNLPGTPVH